MDNTSEQRCALEVEFKSQETKTYEYGSGMEKVEEAAKDRLQEHPRMVGEYE